MTWHVHGGTGTETRVEEKKKKKHTVSCPQTDAHLDKHTSTAKMPTVPPSAKPRRQHLGRPTSNKYDSHSCLRHTHTHTRTSCHLSPCISGLINNCGGFVSCLFLSCGGVFLQYMSVSVVLPVNTVTRGIQLTHIAALQSDAAAEKIKGERCFSTALVKMQMSEVDEWGTWSCSALTQPRHPQNKVQKINVLFQWGGWNNEGWAFWKPSWKNVNS